MLKTLEEDYDFIEIVEEPDDIYPQTEQLLKQRYHEFLENPGGKDWNDLKKELKKKLQVKKTLSLLRFTDNFL